MTFTPWRSVWAPPRPRHVRERLLVAVAERLEARGLEPLDDERARLRAAGRADLAALHVVGRQRLQIAQQHLGVEEAAADVLLAGEQPDRQRRTERTIELPSTRFMVGAIVEEAAAFMS